MGREGKKQTNPEDTFQASLANAQGSGFWLVSMALESSPRKCQGLLVEYLEARGSGSGQQGGSVGRGMGAPGKEQGKELSPSTSKPWVTRSSGPRLL